MGQLLPLVFFALMTMGSCGIDPLLHLDAETSDGSRYATHESPRELRRLHYLREWSHEQDE